MSNDWCLLCYSKGVHLPDRKTIELARFQVRYISNRAKMSVIDSVGMDDRCEGCWSCPSSSDRSFYRRESIWYHIQCTILLHVLQNTIIYMTWIVILSIPSELSLKRQHPFVFMSLSKKWRPILFFQHYYLFYLLKDPYVLLNTSSDKSSIIPLLRSVNNVWATNGHQNLTESSQPMLSIWMHHLSNVGKILLLFIKIRLGHCLVHPDSHSCLQLQDLMAYLKTFILDISPELHFLISLIDTKLVSVVWWRSNR